MRDAVILTVGLIAAVTLNERKRSHTKLQNPARQVMVKREDEQAFANINTLDELRAYL